MVLHLIYCMHVKSTLTHGFNHDCERYKAMVTTFYRNLLGHGYLGQSLEQASFPLYAGSLQPLHQVDDALTCMLTYTCYCCAHSHHATTSTCYCCAHSQHATTSTCICYYAGPDVVRTQPQICKQPSHVCMQLQGLPCLASHLHSIIQVSLAYACYNGNVDLLVSRHCQQNATCHKTSLPSAWCIRCSRWSCICRT